MGQREPVKILLTATALENLAQMPPKAGTLLLERIQRLTTFPESGSPVTYAGFEHLRQVIFDRWQAVYRYDKAGQTITILFVKHQRQQWPRTIP